MTYLIVSLSAVAGVLLAIIVWQVWRLRAVKHDQRVGHEGPNTVEIIRSETQETVRIGDELEYLMNMIRTPERRR